MDENTNCTEASNGEDVFAKWAVGTSSVEKQSSYVMNHVVHDENIHTS